MQFQAGNAQMQTVGGIYFPPLELIGEHPPCRTGTDKSNEISVTAAPVMNVVATGSGGERSLFSPLGPPISMLTQCVLQQQLSLDALAQH